TGDEDDSVFLADGDDFEVLDGAGHVTHVTGHLLVFPDAAGSGAATDRTGSAVHHGTVGHAKAAEAPALDRALEAVALAVTDHVDPLAFGEGVEAGMFRRQGSTCFEAELLDEALRS